MSGINVTDAKIKKQKKCHLWTLMMNIHVYINSHWQRQSCSNENLISRYHWFNTHEACKVIIRNVKLRAGISKITPPISVENMVGAICLDLIHWRHHLLDNRHLRGQAALLGVQKCAHVCPLLMRTSVSMTYEVMCSRSVVTCWLTPRFRTPLPFFLFDLAWIRPHFHQFLRGLNSAYMKSRLHYGLLRHNYFYSVWRKWAL